MNPVAVEIALAAALLLTELAWFAGWPRGLPPALPAAAALLLAGLRFGPALRSIPRPAPETALALVLTVLYRLPALLHPGGWVNRDGAYGAFVALHLAQGLRPAPVFTEGANYQGTLKAHLAALGWMLSPLRDLPLLMVLASLALYLVFVAATVTLARRVGGRMAGAVAGIYLALSPRFLTSFSLNCVGQYVEVLALGGLALALLARVLDEDLEGRSARLAYAGIGLALGVAFWQQPVTLSYAIVVAAALALRRTTWRDPWVLAVPAGALLGVLPVLVWNVQNGWGTGDVVGRDPSEMRAQVEALGASIGRTLEVAFPILAGLSPKHPWRRIPGVELAVQALLPLLLAATVAVPFRTLWSSMRRLKPSSALLPPLLAACVLAIFWMVASGRIHHRPRYLLPVVAVGAVGLGLLAAALSARRWGRPLALALVGGVVSLSAAGTAPRLLASADVEAPYRRLVESLERKGIRTGYADFTQSAPVTMFTAERIVLSCRLGPTPAYESTLHRDRVARDGPDAYVLLPGADVATFARVLDGLGVTYALDEDPVPVFHRLSRPVPVEEVLARWGEVGAAASDLE